MKIAIGSDHRGAEVAERLIRDVFYRNHYAKFERQGNSGLMPGACLIWGVNPSDSFEDTGYDAKIEPLSYSGNFQGDGTSDSGSFDYPVAAAAVAEAVSEGRADFGVLICGTGVGMCIAANKFRGVRAALCYNNVAAELSRRHNNANILCLSGEFLGVDAIEGMVRLWLSTGFDGERHQRRLDRIAAIEKETGL